MAARAMWKAVLTWNGERLPVKLYSALEDRSMHFNLLEAKKQERVVQKMIDPNSQKEIPREEIRRGLELEPGTFVTLSEDELASLEPEASRAIEVSRFVPDESINHQWYDRPYYLGPDGDETGYFTLAAALERSGREGLARWVMRKKQYFGSLRGVEGYLMLLTLRNADEVLSSRDLAAPNGKPPEARESKMAEQLIEALEGDFRPEDFHDEYRERVADFIEHKMQGKPPKLQIVSRKEPSDSLTAQLSRSLAAINKPKGKKRG